MTRSAWLKPCLWVAIVALLVCGLPAWAQGQTAAPSRPGHLPPRRHPPLAVDAPLPVSGHHRRRSGLWYPSGTKTRNCERCGSRGSHKAAYPWLTW